LWRITLITRCALLDVFDIALWSPLGDPGQLTDG
jgi:hypothetical protein